MLEAEKPNEVGPPHHAPVANTASVIALVLVVVPAIVEVDGARRHAALQPWPLVKARHFVAVDDDGRGHRALLRHVAGCHTRVGFTVRLGSELSKC